MICKRNIRNYFNFIFPNDVVNIINSFITTTPCKYHYICCNEIVHILSPTKKEAKVIREAYWSTSMELVCDIQLEKNHKDTVTF